MWDDSFLEEGMPASGLDGQVESADYKEGEGQRTGQSPHGVSGGLEGQLRQENGRRSDDES